MVCEAHVYLSEYLDVEQALRESLRIAREIGVEGTVLSALLAWCAGLVRQSRTEQAEAILSTISDHSVSRL